MEIGDIINDAVRYPSSDWSKVFILGVIFIASFLIIPIFLAFGYLFRIIKATFAGIDELPDFDDLGDMFIDGLKVFIVGVVYAIPLIIISLIISVIFGISHNTAINLGTFTGFNVFALATAYIIYLIVAYPTAQANGLPPKVEPWSPGTNTEAFSLAIIAPMGIPLAIPLASVIMSGSIPNC